MRLALALVTVALVAFAAQLVVAVADITGTTMWAIYIAAMLIAAIAGILIAPPARRSPSAEAAPRSRPFGA